MSPTATASEVRGAGAPLSPQPGELELSVVAPTFNERGNVRALIAKLETALAGVRWEAIFVDDDSADGTAALVKEIAARDPRIRCLRRVGRRGLAGAVAEGALASAAPFVAVIDADLQHDEGLLPRMLQILRADEADLVIGSRFLEAEGLAQGLSRVRKAASHAAAFLGRKALRVEVSDPVSGFFMVRRACFDAIAPKLQPQGFKILFDLIASQDSPLRIRELPYAFRARSFGESKLDGRVVLEYLGLLSAKLSGDLVSPRMVFFGLVGLSGVAVHMAALTAMRVAGHPFGLDQTVAAFTAMTSNFFVNNAVTYRDRRLSGWRLISGYVRFCLLCGVGFVANVAVAADLNAHGLVWWAAGLAGAGCGAAWNYVSTYLGVW